MENSYYIIINGQQIGPMGAEELVNRGLSPESIVWREGLADWTQAKNLPDLQPWIYRQVKTDANPREDQSQNYHNQPNQPQSPYGQGQQPYGYNRAPFGYGQAPHIHQSPTGSPTPYSNTPNGPYGGPYQPSYHTNWMTPAIIATIVGFLFSCIGLIFGIIAITQANSANNAYSRGDIYEGDRCNANAKIWTIVTYVISGLGLISSIIALVGNFFAILGSI